QECAGAGIRVTIVEPGAVLTELPSHNRPPILEQMLRRFEGVVPLQAQDVANAIVFALGQPPHVSVNELLVRPSNQP
ncbi:MAG TPA: oxidoreductase, partial [Conexibacter sp.]|nr:oxidoreductase [Conexibacter sp.]